MLTNILRNVLQTIYRKFFDWQMSHFQLLNKESVPIPLCMSNQRSEREKKNQHKYFTIKNLN